MTATFDRGRRGNLPGELGSFVGRGRELREVRRLLAEARLVTLTGMGGTGKTRLALRATQEMRRAFAGGVWFIDLTELPARGPLTATANDPDVLAYLVMGVLGAQQSGDGSPVRQLAGHLADRPVLLVLDNCEHLLPASAMLADRLLRVCPRLKILATSREPLATTGETVFGVPPLSVPRAERVSLAELARCASVALLVARAQAAEPRFALTEGNRDAVAELCRRLEGLPLAIELAASRLRTLEPAQVLDHLTGPFALLSRGNSAAPGRQQTLRACVDWSYELCSKPERLLWARLSVFVGSFGLDAVEGVCVDAALPVSDLLDTVSGLVDKSVLDRDDIPGRPAGQARYRMLETIRDYGKERLAAAGEEAALPRRHRDWYERLARRAGAQWVSGRQTEWLHRLDREYPNLRAAIDYCLTEPGEVEGVLRLSVSLPPQWRSSRGLFGEELHWLDQALARVTSPGVLRARAVLLAAYLAGRSGNIDLMGRRLLEGEQMARQLQDAPAVAFAAFVSGAAALLRNDLPAAIETLTHGLTVIPARTQPEFAPAVRLQLLSTLGVALGLTGADDQARRCYQELLEITEPHGEVLNQLAARRGLALTAWRRGEADEAAAQLRQGLRVHQAHGWGLRYAGLTLELLAWIAARQQKHRLAATLLGAADTLRTEHDKPITSSRWMLPDHDACEQRAREALGAATFAEAFRHGQTRPDYHILALALDERLDPAPPAKDTSRTSMTLTRREREVAGLVARGLSNKEIAQRLVISQRTAESHLEHILTKLGFTNRAEVAAWIAARQPGDTS